MDCIPEDAIEQIELEILRKVLESTFSVLTHCLMIQLIFIHLLTAQMNAVKSLKEAKINKNAMILGKYFIDCNSK